VTVKLAFSILLIASISGCGKGQTAVHSEVVVSKPVSTPQTPEVALHIEKTLRQESFRNAAIAFLDDAEEYEQKIRKSLKAADASAAAETLQRQIDEIADVRFDPSYFAFLGYLKMIQRNFSQLASFIELAESRPIGSEERKGFVQDISEIFRDNAYEVDVCKVEVLKLR